MATYMMTIGFNNLNNLIFGNRLIDWIQTKFHFEKNYYTLDIFIFYDLWYKSAKIPNKIFNFYHLTTDSLLFGYTLNITMCTIASIFFV